MEKEKLE